MLDKNANAWPPDGAITHKPRPRLRIVDAAEIRRWRARPRRVLAATLEDHVGGIELSEPESEPKAQGRREAR